MGDEFGASSGRNKFYADHSEKKPRFLRQPTGRYILVSLPHVSLAGVC